MQDWKSHASRRTPHRKLRSSSVSVRKHRGRTFIHAKSHSLKEEPRKILPSMFRNTFRRDPESEANQRNFWDWTSQTLGLVLLILMLWFGGGTAYLGWSYFQKPVEEVRVSGNKLLSAQEVLFLSGLRPGILLSELDPYQTASLIQQHPAVRRADVRREFPSRVHLKLYEHTPEVLVERIHPGSSGGTGDHWLVTSERLVLQSVSTERAEGSEFRNLPRLIGLSDEGIRPGVEWNSLPLKRGMSFLMNFREWKYGGIPELSGNPEENTGMDLHSVEAVKICAGMWASVSTGLIIELPPGTEGQVRPRSGLAARHGVTLLNSPGTIDPGYRGEVRVLLINHSKENYSVEPGDRIAQLVISSYLQVGWETVEDLTLSNRGSGGFGSTGV